MRYILILLLLPSLAWADTEHRTAGTVSTSANWNNVVVDTLDASDDRRADHQNSDGIDTVYLTNFGFTSVTGTIDSIYITTEGQGSASQSARRRIIVAPMKDGASAAGEESGNIDQDLNSDTINNTTGPTTPLWNTTWSASDITGSNFGVYVRNGVTQAGVVEIDSVSILVYYTPGGDAASQVIIMGGE